MALFLQTPLPLNSRQSVLVALDTPPPAPRPPRGPLGLGRRPRTVGNLDRTALAGGGLSGLRGATGSSPALPTSVAPDTATWPWGPTPRWWTVAGPGGRRRGC